MTKNTRPAPASTTRPSTVRDLAKLAGVPAEAVRRYIEQKLLPAKFEVLGDPILRVRLIRTLVGVGFPPEEIAALLRLEDDTEADGAVVRRNAAAQVKHVEQRLALLQALHAELEQIVGESFQVSRKRRSEGLAARLLRSGAK